MSIKGIDIAKYQPTSPDPVNLPGVNFIIIKATEGLTADPLYDTHLANSRKTGLPIAAYFFPFNGVGVQAQINFFLATAGNVDGYAFDIEGPTSFTVAEGKQGIAAMHAANKRCGLYASTLRPYPDWGQDWRWVADYRTSVIAAGGPPIPWDIWQYGPFAPKVDGNIFRGTKDQLLTLWRGSMAVPQLPYTDQIPALVTTPNPQTLYNLDGTIISGGHPGFVDRYSPYAVGTKRAAFFTSPNMLGLVDAVSTKPVPVPTTNCQPLIDAAIVVDRAKAKIGVVYGP